MSRKRLNLITIWILKQLRKIKTKIVLWYITSVSLIFITFGVFVYTTFSKSQLNALDASLIQGTSSLALKLVMKGNLRISIRDYNILKQHFNLPDLEFQLYDLFLSPKLFSEDPIKRLNLPKKTVIQLLKLGQKTYTLSDNKIITTPIKYLILPFPKPKSLKRIYWQIVNIKGNTYYLIVACSMSNIIQNLQKLFLFLLLGFPIILIIAAGIGYKIASKSLEPIENINKEISTISIETISKRIKSPSSGDEISQLISHINNMLAKLESSVYQLKQFTSDVSHELRTPLSVIKGKAEVALLKERDSSYYKKKLTEILQQANQLSKLVESLLELARLDATEGLKELETVNLRSLIEKTVTFFKEEAGKKNITLETEIYGNFKIQGNKRLLERLLSNLIDNALKYTPNGGKVIVRLYRKQDRVCIEVKDTGVGMDKETIKKCFQRFYRADTSRTSPGYGLGLALVHKIANLHNAKLQVYSQPNKGTTVICCFP